MQRNCNLHKDKQLEHYCESCKDAVCESCMLIGPHADSFHEISSLDEAATIRRNYFLAYVEKEINPLRMAVGQKLQYYTFIQEDALLNEKKVIFKDITIEFDKIEHRLNDKQAEKLVSLQTDIKFYQHFLNSLEDLTYSFQQVMKLPIKLLIFFKNFDKELKKLESIDFEKLENAKNKEKQIVLQREIQEKYEQVTIIPKLQEKIFIINQIILRLVSNHKDQIRQLNNNVRTNGKNVVKYYNETNLKLTKINHEAKVCVFCLLNFTKQECNESCAQNKSYKSEPQYKQYGSVIPAERIGIKCHYWVAAKKQERKIPKLNEHSLTRLQHKKQFHASLQDIKAVKWHLRKFEIEHPNLKCLTVLENEDQERKGSMTRIAFMFVMTNKFEIDKVQSEVLAELLRVEVEGHSDMVQYRKLNKLLQNPMEAYQKFISEEEEMEKSKPVAPVSRYRW